MNLPNKIIAIDFETTGLVPMYDFPTSLNCIVFEDGEPTGEAFGVKIAPSLKTKLSLEAFMVQSQGVDMLDKESIAAHLNKMFPDDALTQADAMANLAIWAKSVGAFEIPNVAHKGVFDWGFYEEKLASFTSRYKGTVLSPVWICTKLLARRVIPDQVRYLSLSTVATHLEIEHDKQETHDSRYDAELCGRVYFGLKNLIETLPPEPRITTNETAMADFAASIAAIKGGE